MFTIFRENFSESNYDRGRYTWIFTTVNVRYPSRSDSKENVYLHGNVNYRHVVNCSKLIKVKLHGK